MLKASVRKTLVCLRRSRLEPSTELWDHQGRSSRHEVVELSRPVLVHFLRSHAKVAERVSYSVPTTRVPFGAPRLASRDPQYHTDYYTLARQPKRDWPWLP